MKKVNLLIAPAAVAAFFASNALATGDIIAIDVTGWQTWGGQGAASNTTASINIGAGSVITGIGWDVTIATVGASWQSEVTFDIGDSLGGTTNVFLSPGASQTTPGTGTFSSNGIIKLADASIPDIVVADGIVEIEAFESFDDPGGSDGGLTQDANISGTLFLQVVAVPAPAALGLLGVAGLAGRRRRRG
ncbi:MAG: hypothetical protein KC983_09990 [Phycisphaerales bacterium]|nr:hypothetical protein [Phycisphaerales bacterium]